jgi:hypothetical protein
MAAEAADPRGDPYGSPASGQVYVAASGHQKIIKGRRNPR